MGRNKWAEMNGPKLRGAELQYTQIQWNRKVSRMFSLWRIRAERNGVAEWFIELYLLQVKRRVTY